MEDPVKKKVIARLRRAQGQLGAVERMVADDGPCVDVLTQIAAVQGALGRAAQVILGSHIETCVADAMRHGDETKRQDTIEELLEVIGRYGTAS